MTAMTCRIGGFIRGWRTMVRGVPFPLPIMAACLLLLTLFGALAAPPDDPGQKIALAETIPGSGDGRIHVLPTFSALSLKNGDRATIQAIVKAEAGVAGVEARIVREDGDGTPVAVVPLTPAPLNLGGVNEGATVGMWQTEWTAHDLEEAFYRVAITVTDRAGHTYTDQSLRFSDPIAGHQAVGTTAYPDGGMRRLDVADDLVFPEDKLRVAVIDTANGYAYFGTDTSPGLVVKVALGAGANPPSRIGEVTLESGEDSLWSAVIDPANGHAYFGTSTSPGRVVKVALGADANPPSRLGAVTLNSGENWLWSAAIDPINGHAYFGTYTAPGRVVKVALGAGENPPSRVGAVTLGSGENYLYSAVIDPASGYAYFGTWTYPGLVVKVALGVGANPPSRVGAVTLESGEDSLWSAVIDTANGHAYFGTATSPGRVIKVALGAGANPPSRVGAVTLNSGENYLLSAVIDPATGYAYFGTQGIPGRVVKVALGSGANPPSRVGAVTLESGEQQLRSAVIDPASGHAYFGTETSPGRVVKVALGTGANSPARVGTVTLEIGESVLRSTVIDLANGYAYFGTGTSPGQVVKVALGSDANPPSRVGAVTLESGEDSLWSAVIDPASGFAYFGTETSPGRVVKVALGAGANPPSRVGAVTLAGGEDRLYSAVIDTANGYAYFGTQTAPGRVVKVALGAGADAPSRVGAVTFESGEQQLYSAVIDTANGHAYFGTYGYPGRVVKVALGAGANPPTRVGAVTLDTDENNLYSAVIDTANGHAYFGTHTFPVRVVKVALGVGANPPSRVGAITLNSGENYCISGVIDLANGYAYFGTETIPGRVVKVALGVGANPPSRVGAVTLNTGDDILRSAVIATANGHAYFGTGTSPGRVIKMALSQKHAVKGTRFNLPEPGGVQSVSFYSHAASGNLRLALYSAATPPARLWQSGVIANTAAGTWLTPNIASGTPTSLVLPAGNYWLSWQTDSQANVPSYAAGTASHGLIQPHVWGSFPTELTATTLTSDRWSGYITYEAIPAAPSTPGSTAISTDRITWTWQDNADNESSFRVYAGAGSTAPGTVTHTTAANAQSWQQTGLSRNAQYAMRVSAYNYVGESAKTATHTAWTLAATPVAPVVSGPTANTLNVAIGSGDGNPAATTYASYCSTTAQWVQSNGSLGASAVWQTAATWGTRTVTGLSGATTYAFHARARNGAGVETANGPSASGSTHATLTYTAGANGSIVGTSPQVVPYGGNGTAVTANPATGYHFVQWSDGLATATRQDFNVTANITVSASFAANSYTVTFDAQGGTPPSPASKSVTFASPYGTLATTARMGYTFAGWWTAAGGGGTEVTAATTVTTAANHTLYAKWTANSYTVTFDAQGGTTPSPTSESVTFASPYGTLATTARTGYTFAGWWTAAGGGGSEVTAATTVTTAANHTLYAKWTANSYTVSFDAQSGSTPNPTSKSVTFASAYGTLATTSRAGYTFAGWWTAAGGGGTEVTAATTVTTAANHTLYAKWTANSYTVTFDAQGGTPPSPASKSVTFASPYGTLATTSREGYSFVGWRTAAGGGGTDVTAATAVTTAANHTLYAHWTINEYTLTFDSAGGSTVDPITQDYGTAVTAPTDPTRTGYTFTGWTPAVPATMPAEDRTLTAQWTVNQYTLTFGSAGGSTVDPITQDYGTAVTAPADPTRTGYTFAGWNPAVPATIPAENVTLMAQWTAEEYTVTFDGQGGTTPDPATKQVTFGEAYGALATTSREGYTFAGWWTEASGGGTQVTSETEVATADNHTLYAHWMINEYTLTFDSAGGSTVDPITQNYGTAVIAPAAPTREGYTFAGWTPAVPATMPAANVTLTAQWTVNQYTLTFDSAGGTAVDPITQNYGMEVTAPAAPTREGYTFTGWTPAVPATMPAENVTLMAQWTVNQYTLTFDSAGGTAVAPITQDYATAVTAPADPTRTGYTFAGWNPAVPATMPAENVTLTAQWNRRGTLFLW